MPARGRIADSRLTLCHLREVPNSQVGSFLFDYLVGAAHGELQARLFPKITTSLGKGLCNDEDNNDRLNRVAG